MATHSLSCSSKKFLTALGLEKEALALTIAFSGGEHKQYFVHNKFLHDIYNFIRASFVTADLRVLQHRQERINFHFLILYVAQEPI